MKREDRIRLGAAVAAGIGPVTARRAVAHWGSWTAAAEAARRGDIPAGPLREGFAAAEERGGRVLADCAERGVGCVLRGAAEWPAAVECLGDVPEALFYRGRLAVAEERSVGIVGARECSAEGARGTRRMAARLAEEGWAVVSGLARGIDAAAHAGCLEADGETAAVLGCGPDVPYPPENARLAERIAERGLLLSEFAPGTPPRGENFPRRNRILAALSDAVVVVECRVRSGALVTAKHALEHGRDLFAVPGAPHSPVAAGPLQLLRQGARAIRHAEDLLEDLGGFAGPAAEGAEEREALRAVQEGARGVPQLAEALGCAEGDARDRLARLELLGLVEAEEPGG